MLGDELLLLHKSFWIRHLAGDFLECYSVCCQIRWDVNNFSIQFCWTTAAVSVQEQLNVTVQQFVCWFVR